MGRQRSPKRDEAYRLWKDSGGEMPLVDIAAKLGVSPEQVRKWKHQDKWCVGGPDVKGTKTRKVTLPKREKSRGRKSNVTNANIKIEIDDRDLTEKQALFCFYFVKYWNGGKAAKKAGYECNRPNGYHEIAYQLLQKTPVKREIDKLKQNIREGIFLDAEAVLQKYIDIAFADSTDYAKFGRRQVQVMGAFGPVYEGEGDDKKPVMKTVNYVDFKESDEIDGTIITEISQGKDGAKIKFADKMKALEKLELYFDILPDKWKRRLEEEKLEVQKKRLDIDDKDKTMRVVIIDNIPDDEDDPGEDNFASDGGER